MYVNATFVEHFEPSAFFKQKFLNLIDRLFKRYSKRQQFDNKGLYVFASIVVIIVYIHKKNMFKVNKLLIARIKSTVIIKKMKFSWLLLVWWFPISNTLFLSQTRWENLLLFSFALNICINLWHTKQIEEAHSRWTFEKLALAL